MLTNGALRDGAYRPPGDVDVRLDDEGGGSGGAASTRSATVHYVVDGRKQTVRLRLVRSEDSTMLVFHRWQIVGGTGELVLPGGVPYQVGDTKVTPATAATANDAADDGDANDVAANGRFQVFPGTYQVGYAANPLLTGGSRQVTVARPGTGAVAALDGTLVKGAAAEVRRQINAYLDDCAEQPVAEPPNCPLSLQSAYEPHNISWTIDTYPKPTIGPGDDNSGTTVSTAPDDTGSATASYEIKPLFGTMYEPQTSTVSVEVFGPVVVTNGKIDWLSPADFASD